MKRSKTFRIIVLDHLSGLDLHINGQYQDRIPNWLLRHFNWPNQTKWRGSEPTTRRLGHYYVFAYFLAGQFGFDREFTIKVKEGTK